MSADQRSAQVRGTVPGCGPKGPHRAGGSALPRPDATDGSAVQRQWWNGLWQYPQFRSVQRKIGLMWGVTLLGEAAIRALLTRTLGTEPMVLVNNVVPLVVIAGLVTITVAIGRRAQAAAARHGHDITPPSAAPAAADGVVEAG